MLGEMDVGYTMLSDPTEVLDTPADGEYRMYAGGTTIAEVEAAPNAATTCCCNRGTWKDEEIRRKPPGTKRRAQAGTPMGVERTGPTVCR